MLAACGGDESLAPTNVLGEPWRLVSLQDTGGALVVVQDPSRYTVQFGADGRMMVRSDCNSCGGAYTLTDSSLDLGALACTRAFCGEASLDSRYTAALDRASTVVQSDGGLAIIGGAGTLRFRK